MNTSLISNRYALGDRLGSGGMSTVYAAEDQVLERTVAVKMLAEHLSDDEKFVARFRREALAVAKLVHPNIVQVYDTGVDNYRHYIVMEYVEGRSVAQLLQARGRLGPDLAVEIGGQSCAGLEYAHRQGIIHRDVKPGNLMVVGGPAGRRTTSSAHEPPTGEMTVKLTDFGIARAAEQTRLTQVGSVVGTAAYLAPEQARGEEATPSADVYALGVVLYQLLTGRLPWEGSTLAELAIRRENERPLSPTSYDPDVPETLSRAVLRSLESDPADRYTSARELARALEVGLQGREPPGAEDATTAIPARQTDTTRRIQREPAPLPPPRRQPAPPRRSTPAPRSQGPSGFGRFMRIVGILLVIAVLAAIVAAAILLLTDAGQSTDVGDFLQDSVGGQIDSLRDFIDQQTSA
ncbi:serine/threonine protein kinase [Thermoleophilia bacterium SCSIO 60948]|nr:serine/threonine protein kinase [Thermoleophilia bacterium SCSIO 60948]